MDRMNFLVSQINKHNYNYYVLDNPTISDADYDKLYDELVKLEKQTGEVLDDSPTRRVGGEILKGFKKYVHKFPLYSLDKCQNTDDLEKWTGDIQKKFPDSRFSIEYKFDGLSIVIRYINGWLESAGTRGNGSVGEDVTEQIKTMRSVPLSIQFKKELIVQGEGMMTLSNLAKYNKNSSDSLKNARNAVSGAIRNLDPKETAKRRLDFFAYGINFVEGKEFKTQEEIHNFLIENQFKVADFYKTVDDINDIISEINRIDKIKSKLDILMDGIVLKLDNIENRKVLGFTSKFPRWAVAYKFAPVEATSMLKDVFWQVGRTGKITPTAIVDPVELAGATVTRATLNNMRDIVKKKVKIGSTVFIRRSNEVIPEILGIATEYPNSVPIAEPKVCPSCGGEVKEIGANIFCTNKICYKQVIDKLVHFASKEAMNIEGLSDKTIAQLYRDLNLSSPEKIYDITNEDLLKLEKFKDKKASNLLSAIEKSKSVKLASFIFALGISNVGVKTAKDLVKAFKTYENIRNASLEELIGVRDIGEIVAPIIYNYFRDEHNLSIINSLFEKGVKIIEEENIADKKLVFAGKKFVLTGTLEKYSRLEAGAIIEKFGGEVLSSVSKETNYVLAGENAGSKLERAKTLEIAILNEKQFEELINS